MRSNFSLVSPKIVKMDTRFRAAVPVKERLTVTPLFLATGDLYARLQYLFQISKQSDCTQSVSSYGWDTEGKHTGKKIVYCTEQTVMHKKSMDWNTETKYITKKLHILWTVHRDTHTWEIPTSVDLVGLSHIYITNKVLLITEL